MALNLSNFRGLGANNNEQQNQAKPREDAQFWVNIGYVATVPNTEGGEDPIFVSLARGIPLDQIEVFDVTKQRTRNMAQLRQAQNELQEAFMAEANKLEPGESKIIIQDDQTGMAVELKRIRGEMEIPVENSLKKVVNLR